MAFSWFTFSVWNPIWTIKALASWFLSCSSASWEASWDFRSSTYRAKVMHYSGARGIRYSHGKIILHVPPKNETKPKIYVSWVSVHKALSFPPSVSIWQPHVCSSQNFADKEFNKNSLTAPTRDPTAPLKCLDVCPAAEVVFVTRCLGGATRPCCST